MIVELLGRPGGQALGVVTLHNLLRAEAAGSGGQGWLRPVGKLGRP